METAQDHRGVVKVVCMLLGVAAALGAYALLPGPGSGLSPEGRIVASVGVLMATWWMTEAIPLEITGLVPLAALPLLGVASLKDVAGAYADDIIYLFLGGMMLGAAMERWGVHRRLALAMLTLIGTSPSRLVGGFLVTSAFLSMWVSNTAATVMMLPIGASVAAMVAAGLERAAGVDARRVANFGPCLVLAIAFGATIGGVGTVIGTPPVAQYAAHMHRVYGHEVTFLSWLGIGLPVLLLVVPATWLVLARVALPVPRGEVPGVAEAIREQREGLGRWSRGEALTVAVFGMAALAWIAVPLLRGLRGADGERLLPFLEKASDGVIAIGATLALFIIPVRASEGRCILTWREAHQIPWGILLLFGGGLSLAAMLSATGVDRFIAAQAGPLSAWPTLAVLLAFSLAAIILTEFTSNTALVAAALPVAGAVSERFGLPPAVLLTTVTLSASLGFMLPGGTAPNALAFASGRVSMRQMMRGGLLLDLMCGVGSPLMVFGAWKLGVLPGA